MDRSCDFSQPRRGVNPGVDREVIRRDCVRDLLLVILEDLLLDDVGDSQLCDDEIAEQHVRRMFVFRRDRLLRELLQHKARGLRAIEEDRGRGLSVSRTSSRSDSQVRARA